MSIHNSPLDWRRLDKILRHISSPEIRAARFSLQLSLNIDAFLFHVSKGVIHFNRGARYMYQN